MTNIQKRSLLAGAAAVLGSAGVMAATRATPTARNDPRELMRARRFPNVPLLTHEGKEVRFYDDVLRDRKVVFNVMYTVCSNICTPVTQNILEAQRLLGSFANDIHFYSLSLTPLDDDPAALRAYMKQNHIESGWTFLTGKPENVEAVRKGLGFARNKPEQDADLSNHSGMLRIGNERMAAWSHASALTNGRAIARMIRFELS
ncbi:SCO family protein [Ramlibacter sp. AN1133]|uniref:SCO family protein n=1 Tax=Ramlibacter sp. AN1133 TaxID=3133429 RepID=UPI0030C3C110